MADPTPHDPAHWHDGAARLRAALEPIGLLDDGWDDAYDRAPRHRFVPEEVWALGDAGDWWPIRRADDPDRWLSLIYVDDVVGTQVDDGRAPADGPGQVLTSSTSQPSVVFSMLRHLDVRPGHRVLEIGTGTGWNAALLCARLGDAAVASVEVDPALCARATAALADAGFRPAVACADGSHGRPDHAPYDRIVATVAVRDLPPAWLEQVRPGGVILYPHRAAAYYGDLLLRLTVGDDGTARGRWVEPSLAFMSLRAQRDADWSLETEVPDPGAYDTETVGRRRPGAFLRDADAGLAIGLRVPGCHRLTLGDGGGSRYSHQLWLVDPASASWAAASTGGGRPLVRQAGPRRLWDEVMSALDWWEARDRPDHDRYEIVATPAGTTVLLDGDPVTGG